MIDDLASGERLSGASSAKFLSASTEEHLHICTKRRRQLVTGLGG